MKACICARKRRLGKCMIPESESDMHRGLSCLFAGGGGNWHNHSRKSHAAREKL